jgi:hypothetical protein
VENDLRVMKIKRWRKKAQNTEEWASVIKEAKVLKGPYSQVASKRFNMGTELPTKVMLRQTLVLIQMTFLNNVRKVGRLVLSRTSCLETCFGLVYN